MSSQSEDFTSFFERKIEPFRERFIRIRKDSFSSAWKVSGVVLVCCLAGSGFWYYKDPEISPAFLLMASAVLTILSWCTTYFSKIKERENIFRFLIFPKILSFVEPGLKYSAGDSVSMGRYHDSLLFESRQPDRVSGRDLISGTCSCGVDIGFSRLHTEYKTTHRENKRTVTEWHDIFNGIFFYADFNKHFHGATMIVPDHETGFLGQGIGQFLQKISWFGPGSLAVMENVEFEKLFAVHTTDQVEARYILTPKLMEDLVTLSKQSRGGTISVSFNNSRMYVAFPGMQDSFTYNGEEISPDFISRIVEQISFFTGIAARLNLHVRIWTKE